MKRTILIFAILSSTVLINAETPLQVVQRVRGKYPNLPGNPVITVQALREIASDPSIRGGILVKTSGNNCQGYSCDIICYQDRRYADVFINWERDARPAWQEKTASTEFGSRCQMQPVGTEPPPNPGSNCETEKKLIKELQAQNAQLSAENSSLKKQVAQLTTENTRLQDQLKEWDARLNTCLKEKDELQKKYDSVSCKASILGIHVPCVVVK